MKNWVKLIVSILICQMAGVIGSIFTFSSIPTWFATIKKPFFMPPNWVFGPAWLILYTLMGISAYLIYEKGIKKKNVRSALIIFAAQLVLNSLWSILFFGLQSPFLAFVEIIPLWFMILFTIIKFYQIDRTAAYLLIPYILWGSFAVILTYHVWVLNL